MNGSAFVYYWMIFAVLVPVFSAVVFLLARKAGYLKNQDRLRYLALWAEVPENKSHGTQIKAEEPDRQSGAPSGRSRGMPRRGIAKTDPRRA